MRLLISVARVSEVAPALAGGAGVLDVKDPRRGSLGRARPDVVRAGRAVAAPTVPVSAALGDAPSARGGEAGLARAAAALARAGASLLKLGLAGCGPPAALASLRDLRDRLAPWGAPAIVAVAFADDDGAGVSPSRLPDLAAEAGASGAMLDTLGKGRSLLRMTGEASLARWIAAVKARGLTCGVAGSLTIEDAAAVAALGADVVGLRGSVCVGGRRGILDEALVRRARAALDATVLERTRVLAKNGVEWT